MNHGPNEEDLFERGVELFNGGEYFLAHEAWEDWWRASSHPQKQTNQGIVQIAVAMHHASKGNFSGARSVMERALRNLEGAPDDYQGLDFVRLRADMQSVLQKLDSREAIQPFRIIRK